MDDEIHTMIPITMVQRIKPLWLQVRAFAVHLYTASGAVLAFFMVLAAIRGDVTQALWIMLVAMIIDGTDGWLARRFHVREVLPWFDGRRLDDIVDYLTYVFAPVLLLWTSGYLPTGLSGMILAALPLLASGYQFCRIDAKTSDNFFLGFPSYWNVIAFYIFVFKIPSQTVGLILLICSVLVFVPIRYLYPSRTLQYRRLTLILTGLWLVSYAVVLLQMPAPKWFLLVYLIAYPIYYTVVSLYLTLQPHYQARKN